MKEGEKEEKGRKKERGREGEEEKRKEGKKEGRRKGRKGKEKEKLSWGSRWLLVVCTPLIPDMVDMLSCSHIFLPEASSKSTKIDQISSVFRN